MMAPYPFGASGIIFLPDVEQPPGGTPTVQWQSCGGGTYSAASQIGAPQGQASFSSLPGGAFAMSDNEEIVVGEIYYDFSPMTTQSIVSGVQLYRTAVYAPRLNTLVS